MSKKIINLVIWSLGAYVGTASGLGNALGYFVQAKVYHKENPIELSYSVKTLRVVLRTFAYEDDCR